MGTMTNSRPEILQQLQDLGVEAVSAEYDGSADSGQIGEPAFGSDRVPHDLLLAVQDLFYQLLDDWCGGWELDDGSFGQVTWNIKEDRINLVNNMRPEPYDTQEKDL